nr:PTS glucose/sucrose transporter subunit IIB [uncultured Clostridium sp.]
MKNNYDALAKDIIREIGGKENVQRLTHCITRLRFILKDSELPKTEGIKKMDGVLGVVIQGGQYQVIVGNELSEHGTDVVFIDDIPEALSENRADKVLLDKLRYTAGICSLQKIPEYLGMRADRLITDRAVPDLRYYHYYHDDGELFVLFNEDLYQDLEVNIVFPMDKPLTGYDPMENKKISLIQKESSYKITLSKGETVILYTEEMKTSKSFRMESPKQISLFNHFWTVEVGKGCGRPNQRYWEFECLPELENLPQFKDFSGELIYRTEFSADSKEITLDIEDSNEVVKVRLNGCDIGRRISYPYRYNLSGHIKKGKNVLEIRVINSLGRYMKDYLSQYMFMEPLGITGDMVLKLK